MRQQGLQVRFMMVVITVTTLLAIIAAVASYKLGYERALEGGRTTLNGLITAVEKSVSIGAYAQDRVLLQEVIDGISQHELVDKVQVLDAQGKSIVIKKSAHSGEHASNEVDVIKRNLVSPFDHSEVVGEIRVTADIVHMQNAARRDANSLAIMFVLQSVLLAFLIYLIGDRLVSKPIVKLAALLRHMQPGTREHLDVPAGHERDEIGSLVDGANTLLRANEEALHKERDLRAQIEKMEAQYRQIFDSSSAGIFVLGPDGHLINCNPTALRVLGMGLNDMQHLRGEDFIRRVFARPSSAPFTLIQSDVYSDPAI